MRKGWKHSKLSDVKVWRMRDTPGGNIDNLDPNDASEVITLVDSQGCRNDEYKVRLVICTYLNSSFLAVKVVEAI